MPNMNKPKAPSKKPKVPSKVEEISPVELFKLAATIALGGKPVHLMNQQAAVNDVRAIYNTLVIAISEWK